MGLTNKKIYLLEFVEVFGYDDNDDEYIEDREIVGFFTSQQKLNDAQQKLVKLGIKDEHLKTTEYDVDLSYNQVNIYVLVYEYTIMKDELYEDYYYSFEPRSSRQKCKILQNELITNNSKFHHNENKIYDTDSDNGFSIRTFKLDCIYYGYYRCILKSNDMCVYTNADCVWSKGGVGFCYQSGEMVAIEWEGSLGGNIYKNSRITYGVSRVSKLGRPYSRYYQMDGGKVQE